MKKAIYMNDLHFEHQFWISQLNLQKDELKIFKSRLEEVVVRWTDREVLAKVEHFQNAFIAHNEKIDTLLHEIREHEKELAKFSKDHPVANDHVHFNDHNEHRDKAETQNKLFLEMKHEFLRFLSFAM